MDKFMDNSYEASTLDVGENTKYKYYRIVPTDIVNTVKRPIKRKHGSKEEPVTVRQNRKEYYSEDSIARFQLESHAKLLPDMNGNKTIINNYLLRFWGPTFDPKSGGIVAYTYIILQSYCWDKDYTWVSLDTIAKQITCSKPTVRKYLTILEDYGFIIRFWRELEEDESLKGTMLVKVRQTLPLLSREQYNNLPKSLRKEHDRLLRRIKRESELEFDLSHNYQDVYEQLRKEVVSVQDPTGILKEEIEQLEEYQEDYEKAKRKMSEEEEKIWSQVLEEIRKHVSKPSFETWFSQAILFKKDFNEWVIGLPNQFVLEWMEPSYSSLLKDVMQNNLNLTINHLSFDIY